MERRSEACVGSPTRVSSIMSYHDNRHYPVRVGDDLDGQNCERHLAPRTGTKSISPLSPGALCLSKDRQLYCAGLHQLPRTHFIATAALIVSEDNCVEYFQTLTSSNNTCVRHLEQGGGSSFTGEPFV